MQSLKNNIDILSVTILLKMDFSLCKEDLPKWSPGHMASVGST